MEIVKKGYKKTEVGIIPEDWNVQAVSQFGEVKRGAGSQYIRYVNSNGIRLIRINDFFEDNPVFVSPTDEIMRYAINEQDVLFAGTGASAGASYIPKNAWIGLPHSYNAPRIRVYKNQFKEYLLYSLQSEYVAKQQKAWFVGAAQPFLDTTAISNFKIATPPTKAEQTAIAAVLSDADALITQLEKLIAKKRNIKQGAMQQLLTGKKRLPGFNGMWEVKKLGEVLKVRHGKSQKEIVDENGEFPILATSGVVGRTRTFIYNKPSVLIGRKGTIDVPQYMDTPFWAIDTIFYTEIMDNAFPKFIFYKFNLIDWYSHNEASGVPSLNAKSIEKIELLFPPTKEEQTLIAQILYDMDAEIEALEKKLEKYKMIKQGMMQNLLTGKIRLV
ncbi:MAG: restriction endonuclease subunit S [Candidatus Brocadia sp.]|nr:restriction endonuclease subunit S [Candidatus Brocadia sp.]